MENIGFSKIDLKLYNSDSNYKIASNYFYGINAKKSYKEALKYYLLSSDNNYDSQFMIGLCYQYSLGTSSDYNLMMEWYNKASNNGSVKAKYSIGFCYYFGIGVHKDRKIGFGYIKEAADLNDGNALSFLGYLYGNGIIVDKDPKYAKKLYVEANKYNSLSAYLYLSNKYTNTSYTDQELKILALNDANYQYRLGERYLKLNGKTPNYKQAVKYYEKAVLKFHPAAMYELARLYSTNKILDQDGNSLKNYGYRCKNIFAFLHILVMIRQLSG